MFYRVENHEAQPSGFWPDKTRAASFLNSFKNIPEKACVLGVRTKVQIVRGKILAYKKNKLYPISILYIKNINEECFIGI